MSSPKLFHVKELRTPASSRGEVVGRAITSQTGLAKPAYALLRALTSPTTEAQGSFQPLPIATLGHQSPSDVHGRASKLSQVGIWPELVAPMIKAGMDSSCSSSEAPCEDAPDALIGAFAFAPTPALGLLAKCNHPPEDIRNATNQRHNEQMDGVLR